MNNNLYPNDFSSLTTNIPVFRNAAFAVDEGHMADKQYAIILNAIKEFEDGLDNDHEVALMLTSFGQTVILNVTSIGFHNPDVLKFYGFVSESKATLIQHISQLNFLIMSAEKADQSTPPRRIGFSPPTED